MNEPKWLERAVACFDRESEELVAVYTLVGAKLSDLQSLWNVPENDPMFAVFDIEPRHVDFLRHQVNCTFDLDKFDYQLVAHANDLEASRRDGGFMGQYPSPKDLPAFPGVRRVKAKSEVGDDTANAT